MNATNRNNARRRDNAMAAFIETIARVRREQMAGKLPATPQANAANVAALDKSAAILRKGIHA